MTKPKAIPRPTLKSIATYVKKNVAKTKKKPHPDHANSESIREETYKGHHIVVRTSYQIEVDGTPITGHMGVSNNGQVHYHPIPNISFSSAVDMVKQIIDVFPDNFTSKKPTKPGHQAHGTKSRHPARKKTGTTRAQKRSRSET
jgi:hypothetical protein